jgi:hypothetical protein
MIMKIIAAASLAAVACAATLPAQQPDSLRRARARADSIAKARADSIAAADSIALIRALAADTGRRQAGAQGGGAAGNLRLLPDISAIADLVADLSPESSTQEDGSRFGAREVELALSSAVDPYFRADFILGLSDVEGISIEEAYATAYALPWGLQARLGRFHMPFGKQNTTHRAELHTIEYPYVLQRFLGEEGLKGTGLWASRIFAPLGYYQELILTTVNAVGETADLLGIEPPNRHLSGLGYSARFRNYWDLSEAANLEISASALTSRRLQPLSSAVTVDGEPINAVAARQSAIGADITYRWRPLQQGLYKSFILQAEFLRQLNERSRTIERRIPVDPVTGAPSYAGPDRDFTGAYVFARYQLTRRLHLGARGDWLQDPETDGGTLKAGSGYLEWFPSEFSKLVAAYERRVPSSGSGENRILFQATFAVGPHRPHPF